MSIPEPAVKRTTLVCTAGILWSCIGLFLFGRGITKILPLDSTAYIMIGVGIFLGILQNRLMFKKIIDKNLLRIKELSPHKEKICVFAFQAMQSYLIALFMIGLGILMKHLPIPPLYYGTILLIIGTALFTSSLHYFSVMRSM